MVGWSGTKKDLQMVLKEGKFPPVLYCSIVVMKVPLLISHIFDYLYFQYVNVNVTFIKFLIIYFDNVNTNVSYLT